MRVYAVSFTPYYSQVTVYTDKFMSTGYNVSHKEAWDIIESRNMKPAAGREGLWVNR